jgi:diguanylate cyclase (GGDEF)-like protein/PAS domain S-box-containing protein
MASPKDRVSLIITRMATLVAVVVAISLPLLDLVSAFRDAGDALEFKAKVKAHALSGLIASTPDVWMFAENRLQGLISREPVPLADEQVKVFDTQGNLVTQSGTALRSPVLSKRQPLYDAGRVVGQLEVSGSLRGLVFETVAAAVLGLLLGGGVFMVMSVLPLRALRRVTDALFEEKERAVTTLDSISDAVITTDARGRVRYLNPTAERLLGTTLDAVRDGELSKLVLFVDSTTGEPIEASLYRALEERHVVSCKGNNELCRPDKTTVAVEERSAPIFDQEGKVVGGVMVLRDVTAAREYMQRRSWEATHDTLTKLVNRREFEKRVRDALTDARCTGSSHVVCYLDLDRFKVVNDACGHAAGDELLIQIARLMQARIRDADTLARLGGDEFGVLLEGCEASRGRVIAAEILAAVKEFQFIWESRLFTIGVSIGLTAITAEHIDVAEVLGEADSACYWAKEQGRNRVCVYLASDMNLAARRSETGWVARINAAFEEQRFVLYQQEYRTLNPAVSAGDHLEILLRMIGENGEIIVPGRFLPAAERYNLMPEIDRWVIQTVFSRYHELLAQRGGRPLTCAINLSGASINADGFLEFVRQQTQEHRLSPGAICFEVTETVAVNNLEAAAEFIMEFKALGFQFALDDFGTGTSSFGYLKRLPVDYLKIDGGFVKDIEHDRVDHAMTETINRIGHIMGMLTIAEFAENEAIIDKLQEIGVDFAQGYGVCRPTPLFATADASPDTIPESALEP